MARLWKRRLKIVLQSSLLGREIVIDTKDYPAPKIEVTGSKYLSSLKDEFKITIHNLTYAEVSKILLGKYFLAEVYAGYESTAIYKIFRGAVIYISNEPQIRESTKVHILCVSELVGQFTNKLNFTMNSGMNMYACLDYIQRRAGVIGGSVSESLRDRITTDLTQCSGSVSNIFENFADGYDVSTQGDSSGSGATVSIFPQVGNNREIRLSSESGSIIRSRPKLTTSGLTIISLPVFNYMAGDKLLIDNKYIDMSISTVSEAKSTTIGNYLDSEGVYILYEMSYTLDSIGGSFEVSLKARSRSLLENLTGGALK